MIDTVQIATDALTPAALEELKLLAERRYGVSMSTGEVTYSIDKIGSAIGANAVLSMTIRTEKWVSKPGSGPVKEPCTPELHIEVSLHKAMVGHNILGGPTNLNSSVLWLLDTIDEEFGIQLPHLYRWRLRRIDLAETFDLGNEEAVNAWLDVRRNAYYPRRDVISFRHWGFVVYGNRTELRAYAKGDEFIRTGLKRLYSVLPVAEAKALSVEAMRYLRVEVSLKRAFLDERYPGMVLSSIPQDDLATIYDEQWGKFMREQEHEEGTVRRAVDVWQRLSETYEGALAVALYGAWYIVAANGERWYRDHTPRSTAYRHVKLIRAAGIAMEGTDVRSGGECIPLDFIPRLDSPRRLTAVSPEVQRIEARYA